MKEFLTRDSNNIQKLIKIDRIKDSEELVV